MASEFNAVRARLGTLFRDYIQSEWLIPVPDQEVTPIETLIDRLAFSLSAAIDHDSHAHDASTSTAATICDRMTLLYGRMWRHVNVRSIHRFWFDLVGPAPAAVYQHLHRLLLHGQLVDHDGCPDAYVTLENFRHWRGIRTLFVHGEESEVFNAQSATRSAIRLRHALGQAKGSTSVHVHRIPDYGHMDPILADDAATRSFTHVTRFFAGELDRSTDAQADDDPSFFDESKTRCGPVLRSARVDGPHIVLRYWIEELTDRTALPEMHELVPGTPVAITEVTPLDVEIGCRWFDVTYESSQAPLDAAHVERLLSPTRAVSFLTGSCYYPGTPFDHVAADRTFAGMNALLDSGTPCDAFFLLGDAIYADATAGILDPLSWRDRYINRYRRALNAPAASQLFRRVPTHFAIDDHEIANDFQGPVSPSEPSTRSLHRQRQRSLRSGRLDAAHLTFALRAARSWLGLAHSAEGVDRLWYVGDRSLLSAPFFVMDTRSERRRATPTAPASMFQHDQLEALEQWLNDLEGVDGPKFVFMGAVIAPLTRDMHTPGMRWRDDNFAAYPADLANLVRCIVHARSQGLIFISGDLHLSCTAELVLHYEDHEPLRAWQVVASGLYSPLAFVNTGPSDIDWLKLQRIELPRGAIQYSATPLTNHRSHFLRISIEESSDSWTARATAYDEHGKYLAHALHGPRVRVGTAPEHERA
jgi:cholesterol oxidase